MPSPTGRKAGSLPAGVASDLRGVEGAHKVKSNEEYVAYYNALVSEFEKQSVQWLAQRFASNIIEQEINKDVQAEYAPQLEAVNKAADEAVRDQYDSMIEKAVNAHKNMTDKAILLSVELRTAEANARRAVAKKASSAKDAKLDPIRDLAFSLANKGRYRSLRSAALSIANEVLAFARARGVPLSEAQAETTIGGWLKDKGYTPSPSKRGTSASKQGTSSR
jgi:hypothetical protein